jgi:lipocalin
MPLSQVLMKPIYGSCRERPPVSEDLLSRFEERARVLGFRTEDLIMVNHR